MTKDKSVKIKNELFEQILKQNDITKKEFSQYSKIPYNTVVGWRKKEIVPAYAMVILKDMGYRKKLNNDAIEKDDNLISIKLTLQEKNKLKSIFWGTNYTINTITREIHKGNQKILKKIKENLSLKMQKQIIGKLSDV